MNKVSKLIINDTTKNDVNSFLSSPSHALMIVGSTGNGSAELAQAIALELTGQNEISAQLPQLMTIKPNKHGNISIEDVRAAWSFAKVPTGDDFKKRKCVSIYGANTMTLEAQNSLLKLLEEPPEYMHFIMTVPSKLSILPTIDSRAQKIELKPLAKDKFIEAMTKSVDQKLASQLFLATNGEIYKALNVQKGDSPALFRAKEIIALEPFERLNAAGKALSDREEALALTRDLFRLSFIGLGQSVKAGKSGKSWLKIAKSTEKTIYNLESNGSVKLNMTYLLATI